MELNDLIFLGACTLMSGGRLYEHNNDKTIDCAIHLSKKIWKEVIKHENFEPCIFSHNE